MWVHCNQCFVLPPEVRRSPTENGNNEILQEARKQESFIFRDFFILSCGHILCINCVRIARPKEINGNDYGFMLVVTNTGNTNGTSQMQETEHAFEGRITCPICGKLADSRAITNLDPPRKMYFMPPQQILEDCVHKMKKVSKFQELQRVNLENYYVQKHELTLKSGEEWKALANSKANNEHHLKNMVEERDEKIRELEATLHSMRKLKHISNESEKHQTETYSEFFLRPRDPSPYQVKKPNIDIGPTKTRTSAFKVPQSTYKRPFAPSLNGQTPLLTQLSFNCPTSTPTQRAKCDNFTKNIVPSPPVRNFVMKAIEVEDLDGGNTFMDSSTVSLDESKLEKYWKKMGIEMEEED